MTADVIILFFLFLFTVYVIIFRTDKPEKIKLLKEKYQDLRTYIKTNRSTINPKFYKLENEILISGFMPNRWISSDAVGYNVNKGYEIGVCVDGSPNDMFHVLIHELAHSITSAYNHDIEFWENYKQLRTLCEKAGLYIPINKKTNFCGKYIGE